MTENQLPDMIVVDATSKKFKRYLDNWREIILLVNSVLLWKKKPYPYAIFIITSIVFMQFAYYDPSFLTTVSLLFLFLNVLDYFGPLVTSSIWKQENWSSAKERELNEICESLATCYISFKTSWNSIIDVKNRRPNLYYPSAFVASCIFAWIGNTVNNLFLTYLLVLFFLMLPALVHHGLIEKYYRKCLSQTMKTLKGFSSPSSKKIE